MSRRGDLPGLNDGSSATLADVREHLRQWRRETLEAIDLLHAHRARADASAHLFEDPKAIVEYLDAFVELFGRVSTELAAVDAALDHGVSSEGASESASSLRQIASNASVEQRRCLAFRDKCINRPLPHEDVRPLLNQISIDTRDQLLDYQELGLAASRLEALSGSAPEAKPDEHSFDRRSLFTRFLPRRD
jgi:hypothetical protein